MIYLGNSEITNIYLGSSEISAIYAGDEQIYPTSISGLTARPSTIESKKSGGDYTVRVKMGIEIGAWYAEADKNWVTLSQYSGEDETTIVTVTIDENLDDSTRSASILFADDLLNPQYYSEVLITQYACSPISMIDYVGAPNDAGHSRSGFFWFNTGLTEITSCDYDWTGIKSICSRTDAFFTTPNACLGAAINNNSYADSLTSITYFEADAPDLTYISYPFGADSTQYVSQTLTSCTITSTNNVTYIRQMFRYCTNLVSVKLGDLSRASSAEKGHFQGCYNLQNVEIDALPNEDMSSGNSTSYWCWNQATALTETSLINILNALPNGGNGKKCGIGSYNLAKLTSAAGQTALTNAQNKGWVIN